MRRIRKKDLNSAEYWNRVYAPEERAGQHRLYFQLWKSMLHYLPAGKNTLVDIGCGTGEFLKNISGYRPEYELFGTDHSYDGLLSAAKKCPGARLFLADDQSFNLPRRDFDIATVCEVMEHISDPESFLGRVVDLLKPSGRLIITTPWRWGPSCPEHVWNYDGPEDFPPLARGRLKLVGSSVAGNPRTLITVLSRTGTGN